MFPDNSPPGTLVLNIRFRTYAIAYFCGCRGHDCVVVRFATTCTISAYHHEHCEFESHSCEVYSMQHYAIKFVSYLRQVGGFLRILPFPPPVKH